MVFAQLSTHSCAMWWTTIGLLYVLSSGLLATTLFTFQDYACDNEELRMRCPRDTVISVKWAQYGRLATSSNNDLCPAVTWKPLSERRAAAAYLQRPSPRTDWLSRSVSMTTVPMTTVASNSSWRRAAERITCLAPRSLEVSTRVLFSVINNVLKSEIGCMLLALAAVINGSHVRYSSQPLRILVVEHMPPLSCTVSESTRTVL